MAIQQEWWQDKLAEYIYASMRLKEQSLPAYCPQYSPRMRSLRRHLVDLLAVVTEQIGICAPSQHLAVYLLDHLLENITIEPGFVHLAALTCLLVAVKFEDCYDKIPSHKELNSFLPTTSLPVAHLNAMLPVSPAGGWHLGVAQLGGVSTATWAANQMDVSSLKQLDMMQHGSNLPTTYTPKQYMNMELAILKYSNWNLFIPTTAHFLPYFMKVAVDEDDLRDGVPIESKHHVEKYLSKHVDYFREISLQDVEFMNYKPSLLAAACIAASRFCLRLTPTWPKQLELMTDLYLEELLPCVQPMLQVFQKDSMGSIVPNDSINVFPTTLEPGCIQLTAVPSVSYLPYQPIQVTQQPTVPFMEVYKPVIAFQSHQGSCRTRYRSQLCPTIGSC